MVAFKGHRTWLAGALAAELQLHLCFVHSVGVASSIVYLLQQHCPGEPLFARSVQIAYVVLLQCCHVHAWQHIIVSYV
jgi:hypothetical protein